MTFALATILIFYFEIVLSVFFVGFFFIQNFFLKQYLLKKKI